MPSASPASSMSLGELAICEDFLDGHREYATDLLSNIEKIRQWHRTDSCPETREGRTCTVCELYSADGLMGATKKALVSYNDAEKHLQEVRASLGKSVPSRGTSVSHSQSLLPRFSPRAGAPSRETLFKSNLTKAVFLCIVTVGDTLRSQQATWQARLQSEVATLSSSAQNPQHSNTGPSDLDKNRNGDILVQTYSDPKVVGPENLTAVSTGLVPETTSSSSMFVVFRRCLSSDCPCETNSTSTASNTNLRGACGSQVASKVPPSSSDSKKTRTSKVTAKLEAAIRGGGSHATRSMTTNLERRSRGRSDTSDAPAKARTNVQTQKSSTYHDLNNPNARALDAQRPPDVMLGEREPSTSPRSETALLTQEIESSSSPLSEYEALIVDPRVFRLRVQIARSDDARRALMEWCRAWIAKLQLDLRERHGTGPEISLTHESIMKGTRGYPSPLTRDLETVEPGKSLCMTGQAGEAATNDLSHGDDETTAQELRFNSEQEELKGRWLTARQKRYKDRKRRPALIRMDLTFFDQIKEYS